MACLKQHSQIFGLPTLQYLFNHTFVRFLVTGVANTLVGLSAIFAAKAILGFGDALANFSGYGLGLCVSYLLNSRFTFKYKGDWRVALPRFLLVFGIAYIANLVTVLVLINLTEINSYIAQVSGIPVYLLFFYMGSRTLVFREG